MASTPPAPDGFEVVRELGRGGFGVVLLGRQLALDRLVALKRLPPAATTDPDAVLRFRREARALALARDPRVVAVYDLREDGRLLWLVMEYVPGGTLRDALRRRALSPPERRGTAADVAWALSVAHARGIVHRDVTPANVFVGARGAKLGDFGLARLEDPHAYRTRGPSVAGTRGYLAPEVMAGASPDARADVYSLGVTVVEALTGSRGVEAVASVEPRSLADVLRAAVSDLPVDRPTAGEIWTALGAAPLSALSRDGAGTSSPTTAAAAGTDPSTVVTDLGHDQGMARGVGPAPHTEPEPEPDVPPSSTESSPVLPPVYAPRAAAPAVRRPHRRAFIAAGTVGAVLVGAATVLGLRSAVNPALAVEGVSARVSPAAGDCPDATFLLVATIRTNGGAGQVTGRWHRPDGTVTDASTLTLGRGDVAATASLRLRISGDRPLRGSAWFEVLSPGSATSAPVLVRYSCR